MDTKQTITSTIDPEYLDRLAVRKAEIDRGSWASPGIVAALALGSVPVAIAALSKDVYAQGTLPTAVKNVLDFALALEIFENEFYKAVLGTSNYAPYNTAFATVRALAAAQAGAVATLQQIQKHEAAHVATLLQTGATDVFNLQTTATNAQFDFTGNRSANGGGPFAKATTNLGFLLEVAQGAEDTGVRAYKGQAANLMSQPAILEAALRIHSVEARHAARIRRVRRALNTSTVALRYSGTVRGGEAAAAGATDLGDTATVQAQITAAFNKIYGAGASSTTAPSESNATQAGVVLAGMSGVSSLSGLADALTEAFDEPLDRADVVAIVQPFYIPTIS